MVFSYKGVVGVVDTIEGKEATGVVLCVVGLRDVVRLVGLLVVVLQVVFLVVFLVGFLVVLLVVVIGRDVGKPSVAVGEHRPGYEMEQDVPSGQAVQLLPAWYICPLIKFPLGP